MPTQMNAIVKFNDFILWILPIAAKFPREYKFTLGVRLQDISYDMLEILIEASYTRDKLALLNRANIKLELLRYHLRNSHSLKMLGTRQYEYASERIDETGRMIGGWIRSLKAPAPKAPDA